MSQTALATSLQIGDPINVPVTATVLNNSSLSMVGDNMYVDGELISEDDPNRITTVETVCDTDGLNCVEVTTIIITK